MKARAWKPGDLRLQGLTLAPPQTWGAIRLVPILRDHVRDDLRLTRRRYSDRAAVVSLDGQLLESGIKYTSYIPHALVVSWSDDGSAAATFGAQLTKADGKVLDRGPHTVRVLHRMARRESGNRLRLLPLHLALEGFLALHFAGPELAWSEYSRQALTRGLDPRSETVIPGGWMPGLDDALRIFEIHDTQVGVLLFVADALASAFVTSHPDDYRELHRTLLLDFYGELLFEYTRHSASAPDSLTLDPQRVSSLSDLRHELARATRDFASSFAGYASGLFGRPIHSQRVYRAGPFQLQRFSTDLSPSEENHLGESISRDDGTLEYLKTYRLSAAQTRRAFLLSQLAAQNWNLDATAVRLRQSKAELIRRLDNAGFGYLIKEDVLNAARRRSR